MKSNLIGLIAINVFKTHIVDATNTMHQVGQTMSRRRLLTELGHKHQETISSLGTCIQGHHMTSNVRYRTCSHCAIPAVCNIYNKMAYKTTNPCNIILSLIKTNNASQPPSCRERHGPLGSYMCTLGLLGRSHKFLVVLLRIVKVLARRVVKVHRPVLALGARTLALVVTLA
jgi:hypothetical protein